MIIIYSTSSCTYYKIGELLETFWGINFQTLPLDHAENVLLLQADIGYG